MTLGFERHIYMYVHVHTFINFIYVNTYIVHVRAYDTSTGSTDNLMFFFNVGGLFSPSMHAHRKIPGPLKQVPSF